MAEGKPPFTLSGKPGDGSYQSFLANETRYSSLARKFPDRAKDLFATSEAAAQARFDHLQKLVDPCNDPVPTGVLFLTMFSSILKAIYRIFARFPLVSHHKACKILVAMYQ